MPRMLRRRPRRAPDRHQSHPAGPFVGMRDAIDPTSSRPELARLLKNCYPRQPSQLSFVTGRPGITQMGAQLGAGGDVQFIGQFTTLAGTEYTVAIVGGLFYTLNWSTSAWTEVVTTANFTTASITVSTSARIYAVTYNNTMVFNDGVNLPWSWTGASGAGGLTSLTNSPVIYGPHTVYYGKLFGIKNTDRSTFVWSEENAANTGYEAGGYGNAWTLSQTDTNALTRLIGANEALYVFRANSVTQIVGEVNANFSSTGTREAISNTHGTTAPGSVFFADQGTAIYFCDASGRPHVLRSGAGLIPIWEDFDETIRGLDTTKFSEVEGYWEPTLELAILGYEEVGATERSLQLCYRGPQAACQFDGYSFTRVGTVKNANGDLRVMHGSTDGYVYLHGTPTGTVWADGLNAGTVPIGHKVHTNFAGYSESVEQQFHRADMMLVARTNMALSVFSETNAVVGAAQAVAVTASDAQWDVAVWDVDAWAALGVQHVAVGINAWGGVGSLRVEHSSGTERFGFVSATLLARPINRTVAMP